MRPVVMKVYMRALIGALVAVAAAPALASSSSCCNTTSTCCCENGHTYWTQREQDAQQWLYMALSADKQHKSYAYDKWYNSVAVKAGYERTFDGKRISSYFFGKDGCLKIGPDNFGSGVQDKFDVRSSDLGLPAKLEGYATLNPRISNVYVDFDWYSEWNQWVKGLHTWINIPFVHTQWNSGLRTKVTKPDPGVADTPGVYYVPYRINTNPPTAGAGDTTNQTTWVVAQGPIPFAFIGNNAIAQALSDNNRFGRVPALAAGKITSCDMTANGLSGIRFGLGYDFIRKQRGNVGIGIDIVAPAANKPAKNLCCSNNNATTSSCCYSGSRSSNCYDNGLYYFMPSIGGQHAWKVGGVLRGQYIVWNKADDHNITMYVDARAHGVLNARSTRLLGLHVGNQDTFNHWLMLKKYDFYSALFTFYEQFERAANLLKAYVQNKAGVEGQATIMFTYKKSGFIGELGYNFFGRRAECIKCWQLCNNDVNTYKYVIRAQAPAVAYNTDTGNFDKEGGFFDKKTTNINTVPTATIDGNLAAVAITGSMSALRTADAVISASALDFGYGHNSDIRTSVAQHPAYYAHTIFGSLGYTWIDNKRTPSLGIIGKVELGHKNTSLRSWGVFVEGGLTF